MEIRTLLLQPNIYHSKIGTISPWDVPPLGLAYLAAVLEKSDFKVSIIDAYIDQLSYEKLKKKIIEINANVIGITANGYSAKYSLATARYLKKQFPEKIIIMGGPYPTAEFEHTLKKQYCDICVIGEGEETFLELIKHLKDDFSLESLKNISGLAYKNKANNEIIQTKPRQNIQDIDKIPFPAWHLFPSLHKYKKIRGITRAPYLPIITSRGCPYNCNWCTKNIHGYKFRARTPENVLEEMIYAVKNFGIKEFAIMDDTFSLNPLRTKKICYLILKNKLDITLNLYNGTRADTVDESLMRFLYSVGLNRLTVGVESGNQEIVNKIGKSLNLDKVLNAVRIAKKYHLIMDGFFIFGHPFDTIKTMQDTIDFAIKADFDHAYFFIAIPFPGTKLNEIVKKEGNLFSDFSNGSDYHIVEGKSVFEMPNLPKSEVEKKYREAYQKFYFRPKKVWSLAIKYGRLLFQYHSIYEIKWLITQFFHLLKFPFKKNGINFFT